MQYRNDRHRHPLSILGFGCMRFTRSGGRIDLDKAEREILAAFEAGINYFDTAYIYPDSEETIGTIFARNALRERVRIADKLPHYLVKTPADFDKYFAEHLRRLQTTYIDCYLMHMLNDLRSWERLCSLGIKDWIAAKKQSGEIGEIGFSYHGNADEFCKILDAYDWDFCQIQYNYLDEHAQAGVTGLRYAASKGIPVIIMEPLRGGKLADVPEPVAKAFAKDGRCRSPAEWAFRWLWEQPEVTCVLSGMNSLEMIAENVRTANDVKVGEFTESDKALIAEAARLIGEGQKVPCTGCRYCMPCPHGVDIPGVFACVNRRAYDSYVEWMKNYFMTTAMRRESTGASKCVGCGKCEKHCPQGIAIRAELKKARHSFEGPVYKVGRWYIKHFMHY